MLFVISLKHSYGGRCSIDKPVFFEIVRLVPAALFMFSGKPFWRAHKWHDNRLVDVFSTVGDLLVTE